MAREVTHDAHGPRIVDEEEFEVRGAVAICQCGLSGEFPFCDGSHTVTTDEDGALYKYEDDDHEKPRHVVDEIVFSDE